MPDPAVNEAERDLSQRTRTPDSGVRTGWVGRLRGVMNKGPMGRVVRVVFVLAAVGLGGYALASRWGEVKSGLSQLGWAALAGALAALLLASLTSMQAWRTLLAGFGSRPPLRGASQVFFVGQLGKYLPGSVWSVVAQMDLGRAYRIPPRRSASSAALAMLVSLASGLLCTACALPFLQGGSTGGYGWAFLAVPVILAALHPRLLNPLLDRLLRLARRPALEHRVSGRTVALSLCWSLLYWALTGLQIWILAVGMGAPMVKSLAPAVGGFAFAWSAGFLVIFAPAGAGVREVILVAMLSPVMDVGRATALALVSRVLTMVADLVAAAVAGWFGRRKPAPAPEVDPRVGPGADPVPPAQGDPGDRDPG
ncbi:lysylphosphatidylglycerol synthase transmembrane domain-containing protein [Streptacidiphilus carbonis]|uniref:lysylphosphatidylglycerol synthase transmembrane domain-containing protein n=1 Tax=Streptacidiphilus carbonis TaxID=105422 RepID=UPI0006935195|nr:lysylphosphatidylglycerol synthase transmembrane domain-containing protein [Streptacidiphilus carbonis]